MIGKFERQWSKQGLTMVEVVVSLAIVSLVMVGLWEGYNLAQLSGQRSQMHQAVAATAEELLATEILTVGDGDRQQVMTEAGSLDCSWQIEADAQWPLYQVILTITDPVSGESWRFCTVKRMSDGG